LSLLPKSWSTYSVMRTPSAPSGVTTTVLASNTSASGGRLNNPA
jgi:hypothetical protein